MGRKINSFDGIISDKSEDVSSITRIQHILKVIHSCAIDFMYVLIYGETMKE